MDKLHTAALAACLLLTSTHGLALTREECQSAWTASSAYKSCHPLWGADKVIGNTCGIYVHCKTPSGAEIQNGNITEGEDSYDRYYGVTRGKDTTNRDPRGELKSSGRDLLFHLEDVKKLQNCSGYLKVGSC